MINMTSNRENIILNKIKYFQADYPDGVPVKILILDLDLSVDELREILLNLEDQGIIFIEDEYVKLVETNSGEDSQVDEPSYDNSALEDSAPLKTPPELPKEEIQKDLTEREIKGFEIIEGLAGDSRRVSRHILEGNLLYGDLKLSIMAAYNLILSLENKGLIKKIQTTDGEYYVI